MEKLAAYCSRLLLLHEGKQVAYDSPEHIFAREDLEAFGIEPPVYTQAARVFSVKYGDCYPVTLDQTQAVRERFPGKLCRTVKRDDNAGSNIKGIPCPVPMFSIQDLGFSYAKDRPVIKALDLELDQRPTAIIGQNGAGKTTALECIEGLRRQDGGSAVVWGKAGIQLQSASLPAHIRPMEAVALFAKWNGTKPDAAMLDALGIGGMKKTQ